MSKTENIFERNEKGLIKTVDYKFKSTGEVDWRAMIPKEFLYINSDYKEELETRFNKKLREIDPSELDDKYLLIMLGGIKEVLRLRGYKNVRYDCNLASDNKAVYTCTIEFIGNYETNNEPVIFSDVASASVYSVSGTFSLFIESIAANRAFVRCVRNFLGINIVGKDEFDPKANELYKKKLETSKINESPIEDTSLSSGHQASDLLEKRCNELSVNGSHSFEKVKENSLKLKDKLESDPSTWIDFKSIPAKDCFLLLGRINKMADKKK